MTSELKGKIFLADERGCTETDCFRSYCTFNFGKYYKEHKSGFSNLYVLNDDTLAGKASIQMSIEQRTVVLLLPVVGAINYKTSNGFKGTTNAGELQFLQLAKSDTITITNPYKNDLVNFLQFWINSETSEGLEAEKLYNFKLDENKNQLICIKPDFEESFEKKYPVVSIGKFDGREEATYKMKSNQNRLFVFVIQGIFEVQGRLLHDHDGLGLWDETQDIELEALSNDAIVVAIELSEV